MATFMEFFARTSPVSSIRNPACIKKTRAEARITHRISRFSDRVFAAGALSDSADIDPAIKMSIMIAIIT
jgi:hypothetical protein